MLLQKPLAFCNVTPVNPNGMTVVDLGEMDDGLGLAPSRHTSARHVSLPPTVETRTKPQSKINGGRHKSLPPKTVKIKSAPSIATGSDISSIAETDDSETDDMGTEAGPSSTGPPSTAGDNLENLKDSTEPSASSSQGEGNEEGEDEGTLAHLRSSNGSNIPRSSVVIRKEKIKTCWFTVWNKAAISEPFLLHTSVHLELGDLFINQFYSKKHKAQVLQVWLLVMESGSKTYSWKQIGPNEKAHHPKLKKRVLAFQLSDARTTPTWILPNTDRRQRATPIIVHGLEE